MDLDRHPELADHLAAAYALGTLRGRARRRFEAYARQNPRLRARAAAWQERLAAMTELQPGQEPSPNVWKRIRLELDRERASAAGGAPAATASSPRWRAWAIAGAFATLAGLVASAVLYAQLGDRERSLAALRTERETLAQRATQLAQQVQAAPEIRYVAVLSDEKDAPAVLVTFDPKHNTLTLKRVGGYDEGETKSLQLWALPPGAAPRSLGVLPQERVIRLTAGENQVREVPALAISLEPRGGVPSERGPTGPVLFKGALLPTS